MDQTAIKEERGGPDSQFSSRALFDSFFTELYGNVNEVLIEELNTVADDESLEKMDNSVDSDSEMKNIVEQTSGKPSDIQKASVSTCTQNQTEKLQQDIASLWETLSEKDEQIKTLQEEVKRLKTLKALDSHLMSFLREEFPEKFSNATL